jgi:hypothetical protein
MQQTKEIKMAKVFDNPITEGLSGKLGRRLVFRKGRKGKTIVALNPVYSENRLFTETQLAHHEAFRQATQYAVGARNNPLYVTLARGADATAYNLAVADWFGKPQVLEIDPSRWTGQPGQTIRVMAKDDTQVTKVVVTIKDENDTILLKDFADPSDGPWWNFTVPTAVSNPSTVAISATAYDLPGNTGDLVWQNN